MAERLSKRFEGHEYEILRDIRLYGSIGAMMRWGASYIAWIRYVNDLRAKFGDSRVFLGKTDDSTVTGDKRQLRRSVVPQGQCENSKSNVVEKTSGVTTVDKCEGLEAWAPPVHASGELSLIYTRRSLAKELVDEFTSKVIELKTENERLNALVQQLQYELQECRNCQNEELADEVIEAIEVLKR